MNRIEPGCLAVVTHSYIPENIGKVVTVIRKTPPKKEYHYHYSGDICWEIDAPLKKWCPISGYLEECFHIERWLMRIDGYTESEADRAITNFYKAKEYSKKVELDY